MHREQKKKERSMFRYFPARKFSFFSRSPNPAFKPCAAPSRSAVTSRTETAVPGALPPKKRVIRGCRARMPSS